MMSRQQFTSHEGNAINRHSWQTQHAHITCIANALTTTAPNVRPCCDSIGADQGFIGKSVRGDLAKHAPSLFHREVAASAQPLEEGQIHEVGLGEANHVLACNFVGE